MLMEAKNFLLNNTRNSKIYNLSLHDALPISLPFWVAKEWRAWIFSWRKKPENFILMSSTQFLVLRQLACIPKCGRSEEHTSELQSRLHLVCRLLLENNNKIKSIDTLKVKIII